MLGQGLCIDPAKIERVFEILPLEILSQEIRAEKTGPDLSAQNPEVVGLAVVGAQRTIVIVTTPELADHQDKAAIQETVGFEILKEGVQALIDIAQQIRLATLGSSLIPVVVETAKLDVDKARGKTRAEKACREPEVLAQTGAGIGNVGDVTRQLFAGLFYRIKGKALHGGNVPDKALSIAEAGKILFLMFEHVARHQGMEGVGGDADLGLGADEEGHLLASLEIEFLAGSDAEDHARVGEVGIHQPSDPSAFFRLGSFAQAEAPDVFADEVAEVGLGVTDLLEDGHLAMFEALREVLERGVEAAGGGLVALLGGKAVTGLEVNAGAAFTIRGQMQGREAIEAIVASREIEDDEEIALGFRRNKTEERTQG